MALALQYFIGTARERIESRQGSPFNADGHREYTRVFKVRVNDKRIGVNRVCRAPGIPDPLSPYVMADGGDQDLHARAVRYSAERLDSTESLEWLVTVQYSTRMPEGGIPLIAGLGINERGFQNQPDLVPAKFRWTTETTTEAPPYDLEGRAFTNSARSPLTPAPTVEIQRPVLTMVRNELRVTREGISVYAGSVNAQPFLGAPARTVKITNIDAEEMEIGDIMYWRVTYKIVFNRPKWKKQLAFDFWSGKLLPFDPNAEDADLGEELEEWDPQFLDAGLTQRYTFGPFVDLPVPIIRNGQQVTTPVLLDGAGLAQVKVGLGNATGANLLPVFLKFKTNKRRNFNKLLQKSLGKIT